MVKRYRANDGGIAATVLPTKASPAAVAEPAPASELAAEAV